MMEPDKFQWTIIVQAKKNVINKARKYWPGLVMQTDGSKLYQGRVGAAVCWREKALDLQKDKGEFLGKNNEIVDIELWVIQLALDAILKEILDAKDTPVIIFYDSQKVLRVIRNSPSHNNNRFLRDYIYRKAEKLEKNTQHVNF